MSSHGLCSVCTHGERERERERDLVSLPLLIETPILLDESPTHMTSFNLIHLPKGHISKYSHIGGVTTSTYEFVGTQFSAQQAPTSEGYYVIE